MTTRQFISFFKLISLNVAVSVFILYVVTTNFIPSHKDGKGRNVASVAIYKRNQSVARRQIIASSNRVVKTISIRNHFTFSVSIHADLQQQHTKISHSDLLENLPLCIILAPGQSAYLNSTVFEHVLVTRPDDWDWLDFFVHRVRFC